MTSFKSLARGSTVVFVLNVGHGNMVLMRTSSGHSIMFDCNVTEDNKSRILGEVGKGLDGIGHIDRFICSHRDADHIRGIRLVHQHFPIREIVDCGYQGTTTDSDDYKDYMSLRNQILSKCAKKRDLYSYGETNLHVLSAKDSRLANNANDQGIVLQIEHPRSASGYTSTRMILPGDSSGETWKNAIMMDYSYMTLESQILLAAHHGSRTFFEIGGQSGYYTEHIKCIKPEIVIVSVGPNPYGHPNEDAMRRYGMYCIGNNHRKPVEKTETRGSLAVCCLDQGGYGVYDWG